MRRLGWVMAAMGILLGCGGGNVRADQPGSADILAGPMVGSVNEKNARIWMQLSEARKVTITCFEVEHDKQVSEVSENIEGPLPFVCDMAVSTLLPNRNYRIEVKLDDKLVRLPGPELIIRTAPPAGSEETFTVALGSNYPGGAGGGGSALLFDQVGKLSPRAFLCLGNMAALPQTLETWPRTHREAVRLVADAYLKVRREPNLQPLLRSTPCYAVWNDLDFGIPGSGKDWVFKKESWAAFQRLWPNPDWGTPDNPGCYFSFTIGDADFFMLDSRMFRDADNDPARKTMLGDVQLDWLKKGLANSRATFKIIGRGSQLLADYGQGDTWAAYQPEQKDFLHWIFTSKISGVIFTSGGHLGEITGIQPPATDPDAYPLFELTSGPLAGPAAAAAAAAPNPNRQGAAVAVKNFGTLDFGGTLEHRFITLRIRAEDGEIKATSTLFATQLKK